MFGAQYYHGAIRKYVIAFGNLFNDIYVQRLDSNGNRIQTLSVPLAYGPKEKWIVRMAQDPNLDSPTAVTVPRMGFEMTSIEYDPTRKITKKTLYKKAKSSDPTRMQYQYAPAPYNIGFQLSVLVKNTDDGLQVIEQIIPYFTPDYKVTIHTIPDMSETRDIPIILQSVSSIMSISAIPVSSRSLLYVKSSHRRSYVCNLPD